MEANDGTCCTQFNKESGRMIQECKLRVVFNSPESTRAISEDDASSKHNPDTNSVSSFKFPPIKFVYVFPFFFGLLLLYVFLLLPLLLSFSLLC